MLVCAMRKHDGGDLVLVGSGGFGRETAEAVRALVAAGTPWRLLGFIDDDPARAGEVIDGTQVLGGRAELKRLPDARIVVCTGRPGNYVSRLRIVSELGLVPERYATIIHPSAAVSSSSSVGPGTVLLAAVRVGAHVAVMPHVTLTHDDVVEDFATLASRSALGGGARIGRCAYIGAGAIIGEQREVGELALVGMGAVVTKDVPAREVWAGVPARRMRAPARPLL